MVVWMGVPSGTPRSVATERRTVKLLSAMWTSNLAAAAMAAAVVAAALAAAAAAAALGMVLEPLGPEECARPSLDIERLEAVTKLMWA